MVEMEIENKPEVSRSVASLYGAIAIFIPVLGILLALFSSLQTRPLEGITAIVVVVAVLCFVEIVMVWILASIYRTRYVLTEEELILKATWLIGGSKRIPLKTVISVERTLIPFGFRLLGASFYGGYYYFPNIGKAFVVITNFKDGVLVRAEHGNYLITPSNPERFIATIEKRSRKE